MKCVRCGIGGMEGRERCARCGAAASALASAPPYLPDVQGIPVARFAPTLAGPPVAPEPFSRIDPLGAGRGQEPRITGYGVALPLVVAPRRRLGAMNGVIGAVVAFVVLVGLAGGMLISHSTFGWRLGPFGAPGHDPNRAQVIPTASPTPATQCVLAHIEPDTTRALTQAQLTTGLLNPATQDYRPIDNVSTFHAGQTAYLTFLVNTPTAGAIGVSFCTPQGVVLKTLDAPAGSAGHYGQFALPLDAQDVGVGVATLSWNGAAVASLAFTVFATAAPTPSPHA